MNNKLCGGYKMYNFLTTEKQDRVGIIRFNRVEEKNVITREFMDEIVGACQQMNNDNDVNVVVITCNGDTFMAGADIYEYTEQSDHQFLSYQQRGIDLYDAIEMSDKPYIAMVRGLAMGSGCEIACACDMVFADTTAKMCMPEIQLGLIPSGGGTQRLIQKIGINRVKQMLLTGEEFSAKTLNDWGIVNYLFEPAKLEEECLTIVKKIAKKSPSAVMEMKHLVNLSVGTMEFDQRIQLENKSVAKLFKTDFSKRKIQEYIVKNPKK